MSDDLDRRTLPPSGRRIADFRKRGDIPLSRDLVGIAATIGGTVTTLWYGRESQEALAGLMSVSLRGLRGDATVTDALSGAGSALLTAATPTAVGAFAAGTIAVVVQIGWPPALKPFSFDPTRLLGFSNLLQIFSPTAAGGRALKNLARLAFIGFACAFALADEYERLASHPALDARQLGPHFAEVIGRLATRAGIPLVALAIFDYVMTRRSINARMRMTPEEAKREYQEQEGDPQIKRRRKRRMRELAKRRIEGAVKTADVVLVNPTEYAVALRYLPGKDRAPRVVAKGRGEVAERIRELARKAGIPIMPQPPLCRLIHKLVPEGKEIPRSLYHAVAEVLAYVYRLRRRAA